MGSLLLWELTFSTIITHSPVSETKRAPMTQALMVTPHAPKGRKVGAQGGGGWTRIGLFQLYSGNY